MLLKEVGLEAVKFFSTSSGNLKGGALQDT